MSLNEAGSLGNWPRDLVVSRTFRKYFCWRSPFVGLNQYESVDGVSVAYDANGNIQTDHRGHTYTYGANNMLRQVRENGSLLANYVYSSEGLVRYRSAPDGSGGYAEAYFIYDGDQEIMESSTSYSSLTPTRRYIRLPGSVDEVLLMIDYTLDSGCTLTSYASCQVWAHADQKGSTIATSDANGNLIAGSKYTYSAYGESGAEGNSGFPFRYTGQKLDAATGLYYYKVRFYDPDVGRFLQTDPLGYGDGMNMYAYAGGDPVNFSDPTGLSGQDERGNNNNPAWVIDRGFDTYHDPIYQCGGTCWGYQRPGSVTDLNQAMLVFGTPGWTGSPWSPEQYFPGGAVGSVPNSGGGAGEAPASEITSNCNPNLIREGNQQVEFSNRLAKWATYGAVAGGAIFLTGAVVASTPVAALGLAVVTTSSMATSVAAIIRINGGVLQGRGGGGYQNVRQGFLALAIGNVTKVGRFIPRIPQSEGSRIAEAITGVAANLTLRVEPGKSVTCKAAA